MTTIVSFHALSEQDVAQIGAIAPGWSVFHGKNKEALLPHLKEAEIVLGWNRQAAEACLQPDSPLRWVQNWGAGVEQLPLDVFADRGIVLTNASGVHAKPISETIFAMMLAFARKLHLSVRHQVDKRWQSTGELNEIHDKTVAIIGVGAIGEETARLAKAFGMTVLGVRRSAAPLPAVDEMFDESGLEQVLGRSDYVVNTLPLTDETRHRFGREQFRSMKPSSVYINIGRGGTTDTEALLEALHTGSIAGAGLDVFEEEPLPASSPLWELENVILTPHNAGSTVYYNERIIEIFLQNLGDYIGGKGPRRNVVDLKKQY